MFSIITIAASIIAPIAMAMPPSDMMSAPTPTPRIAMNAMRMPMGSVRIATSAELACSRNTMQTSATMIDSLQQLALERLDRALDQIAAVVDRAHDDARRKALLHARQLRLDVVDRRQRVLAEPHHDDAAHRVAPAVEIGDAAADRRTDARRAQARRRGSACPLCVAPTTTFSMSPIDLR